MLPNLVTSLTVWLVFIYLYTQHRERYLAYWGLAWLLWAVRYALGTTVFPASPATEALLLPLFALGQGTLMLRGAMELVERRIPRFWWAILAADLAWFLPATAFLGPQRSPMALAPHWLLFAVALIWSGRLFLGAETRPSLERRVAGTSLVLLGLLQATFPIAARLPAAGQALGYRIAMALQPMLALGILTTYYQAARAREDALHAQLEDALTRALSRFLPICSHCKSIRNDLGEWQQLEHYLTRRTGTAFSHGICPSCSAEHYGEEAAAPPHR